MDFLYGEEIPIEPQTLTRSKTKMQKSDYISPKQNRNSTSIKNSKNVPYKPDFADVNDPIRQYKVRSLPLF